MVTMVLLNVAWICAWPCDNVRLALREPLRLELGALLAISFYPSSFNSIVTPVSLQNPERF
jgi:hypothetical protein